MGPIPKLLSLVLLVGGLHMAVAMAGEPACDGPYKGRTLTLEELTTVVRNHEAWLGSDRKPDDQRKTNLCQANLEGADLEVRLLEQELEKLLPHLVDYVQGKGGPA